MTERPTSEKPGSSPADPPEPSPPPLVSWPPPGLERLQGDAWDVVDRLGVGGAVFTLPLLASLTLSPDPWRTGIFGDGWWVLLITSLVGLWVLLAGYVALFRGLRRWRAAGRRGYAGRTVALTLADRSGDTGFLVQGGRAYSLLSEGRRESLLTARLVRAALMVAATGWLSVGFLALVMVSARGGIAETGLALWTLAPVALAGAVVIVLRAWENGHLRRARREWFAGSWTEDLTRAEIREWHESMQARPGSVPVPVGRADAGHRGMAATAALVVLAGVAVPLLAVPLVVTSSVGPIVAQVVVPRFNHTVEKVVRIEALRDVRPPTDPDITALEAGHALYAATARSPEPRYETMKPPPRSYDPIFPGTEYQENPTGMEVHFWSRDLMPLVAEGLDAETLEFLEEKGRHPALAELSILARAEALDEMGAVHRLPFPEDMTAFEIPIPRYRGFRALAYAQIGGAVADAARGRTDAAETRLRELIGAGSLLGAEGQTLITTLIGAVMAGAGAEALANLWDATGRSDDARALRARLHVAQRSVELGTASLGGRELEEMPAVVTDTTAIRGIRWEHLYTLAGVSPCLNLNRIVFGPPDDFDAWLDRVRETLIRYESEEAMLDVMLRGWRGEELGNPMSRLFTQVMSGGVGTCAAMMEAAM